MCMVEIIQGIVGTGKEIAEILSTLPNHRRPNRSRQLLRTVELLRTGELPTTSGEHWTAEYRKTSVVGAGCYRTQHDWLWCWSNSWYVWYPLLC